MTNKYIIESADVRKEASRLVSMANKRIDRLEKAGLESSPAYQKWISEGGQRFGVKGKTNAEVQTELHRLRRFINSQTSTIRGVNKNLKEMANNTGIKYKNIKELQNKATNFFELASKVEQYLRTVDDIASAIGYQKIWEAINVYVKDAKIDLSDANLNIDGLSSLVAHFTSLESKGNMSVFNHPDGEGEIWGVIK